MINGVDVENKCLLIDWNYYKSEYKNSFVIDEDEDIKKIEDIIMMILQADSESQVYIPTYPVKKMKDSIYIYADSMWIKTKLTCDDLKPYFKKYREVEPYLVKDLSEDEKINIDIYICYDSTCVEFAKVHDNFFTDDIKVIYWD